MMKLTIDDKVTGLGVALVEARGLHIAPANAALSDYCADVCRRVVESGMAGGEQRRTEVRQLLRGGGFKPAGRSKPAQEYLLRTATEEGALPAIFNAVDLINAVSLDSGLPISLVSLDRVGPQMTIRYGRPGERYVFNSVGQELDAAGLICLCSGGGETSQPMGSPVKDSLAAKVVEQDRDALACLYVPRLTVTLAEARRWATVLSDGFRNWCGAANCQVSLAPDNW